MQQDSEHPEGVSGEDRTPGVIRARERKANAAVQLRIAGASWDEIAEALGYPTARQALVATEKALERELQTEGSQKHMRALAGRRLERLLRSTWPKATNPEHPEHLQAIAKARDVIDRHAKLFGYDAPAEIIVHNPTAAELESWVARVVQAEVPALQEANIFDAEVIDEYEEDPDVRSA